MYDITSAQILEFHRSMLVDSVRMQSHLRAILKTVKPGDIVLDIGSGTGVLACIACMAGARRVYAVEQGPIVELAKSICRQNGFQDRVIFLNDWSTNINLPEPVDVIVTETIGNIGFEEGILGWIIDAKARLLAAGGRIVPNSVDLVAAPVEHAENYDFYIDTWNRSFCTLNFAPARSLAVNTMLWTELSPASFLSEPAVLIHTQMNQAATTVLSGEASFSAGREGILHGIGCWFAAELAPGITLSNAPPLKTPSWSHHFLPLERPLPVSAGDRLDVRIQANGNSAQWQWRVTSQSGTNGTSSSQNEFVHTTGNGQLHSSSLCSPGAMPKRTQHGEIDLFILGLMDGTRSAEVIARQTLERFPAHLASVEQALEHVSSLAAYYSRWADNEQAQPTNGQTQRINRVG
jgi:protein arginine N-methyltransferase 1